MPRHGLPYGSRPFEVFDMKVRYGINPDFADADEIDQDALDALHDFDNDLITLDDLASQIGRDAARVVADRKDESDDAELQAILTEYVSD